MNFEQLGVLESSVENLKPEKEADWTNYPKGVMWAFGEKGMKVEQGMDLVLFGNIPNGSGLSSSASVEVLTGFILRDMFGFDVTNQDLALIGQYSENKFNGVNCGIMDQFAIAMGKAVIDYFSPKVDGVKMSCIQFFTCGILSGVGMFLTEHPQMSDILAAWMPILYAGVMSCGVAYTLQIVGQKGMNPTVASLILSMESVISVIAGWLILHQTLSTKELMGCVLMFAAIILVQLPDRAKK